MSTSTARLGVTRALAAILIAFGAALAAPAVAHASPVDGSRHSALAVSAETGHRATVAPVAEEPSPKEKSGSGGAARWLMIGSGLLLGLGIGFVFVFMRKGPSSGE
ncbi:MAG TPA: hypothetical protein VHJ17_00275 [Thermomonospora sp.]|nr:hypothetical protein [Thermomonospora sp.]